MMNAERNRQNNKYLYDLLLPHAVARPELLLDALDHLYTLSLPVCDHILILNYSVSSSRQGLAGSFSFGVNSMKSGVVG